MADYALLAGLGQGLQQFGSAVFKSKFLDQLKEQEQIRAEQRAEARQNAKVAETNIEQDGEGVWWRVSRNQNGDVLQKDLAPKSDIDQINFNRDKQKLTIDNLQSQINLRNSQGDQLEALTGLRGDVLRSQAEKNRAQGNAALIRANKPSGSGSNSDPNAGKSKADYVELLSKDVQTKNMLADYQLSGAEKNELFNQAVEQAADYSLDPREVLEQILFEKYGGDPSRTKTKGKAKPKVGTIKLPGK